jgi:membrane protein implicated in regulation of membrane protease activity
VSVLGGIRADVLGALLFVPSVDVHLHRIVLVVVAVSSAIAAYLWGRSARRLLRASRRIERHVASGGANEESLFIARASFSKDLHTAILYGVVGFSALLTAVVNNDLLDIPFVLVLIPVAMSIRDARRFLSAARLSEQRTELERRAEEVLEQEELAPRRWAERLAPAKLPAIEGYEVGQVYKPGTGAMAGDFYDLYPTGRSRLAAVIGDVTGHGIEPSITAFQVKYLLRVFLRQFRDPAQAVEELNSLITEQAPSEELVSLCVVVFDELAGTLRFA